MPQARRFNPRPRCRAGDTCASARIARHDQFQSAPACERATRRDCVCTLERECSFNPRPPVRAGDADVARGASARAEWFQSAPALSSGRLAARASSRDRSEFQSAPACERATRDSSDCDRAADDVSIRARVSSGRHVRSMRSCAQCTMFQSAPACERATRIGGLQRDDADDVSIRARVRAGDLAARSWRSERRQFQSAPACERATTPDRAPIQRRRRFNPRPRASGRHVQASGAACTDACFNPRPRASGRPRRERSPHLGHDQFQSAPACERATCGSQPMRQHASVSIRARVRAGDLRPLDAAHAAVRFQSAPACERATRETRAMRALVPGFNPRPRASGRRRAAESLIGRIQCFNPRPRASGRRGACVHRCTPARRFNPRPRASGRRARTCVQRRRPGCFNPRPRASGRPRQRGGPACMRRCFNPRPRASGRPSMSTTMSKNRKSRRQREPTGGPARDRWAAQKRRNATR